MLPQVPSDEQLFIETERLVLEPVIELHTRELWDLFKDPTLHAFVPFRPISFEKQKERCERWAKRISPKGDELWLNWAARERNAQKVIAHFQVGIKDDRIASLGYIVEKESQNQGFATEGLQSVIGFIRGAFSVDEIKAWIDSRNLASIKLAKKMGMTQIELIKDANFFKGAMSDELVFSLKFKT